jgi:hypothetical protein
MVKEVVVAKLVKEVVVANPEAWAAAPPTVAALAQGVPLQCRRVCRMKWKLTSVAPTLRQQQAAGLAPGLIQKRHSHSPPMSVNLC